VRVVAVDANAGDRFVLGTYVKSGRRWADLVRGACAVVEARGVRLPGVDLVVAGDLPVRKGLGSSGAYLTAVVKCLHAAAGRAAPPAEVVAIVQAVEAQWAGVSCGVMDPYVAAVGEPGKPLLLDCRSRTHRGMPWPAGLEAEPFDTGIERSVSDSPYDARRAELEQGLARLRAARPGLRSLRDLSPADLASLEERLPDPVRRRCRHVVTEVDRVRRAAEALETGNGAALGAVLDEGHRSLSRDFEASTPEVDSLVAAKRAEPGVLGVRLQGAGWGGTLVVLRQAPDRVG
jgi:galactokinase